jgi:hypothetical protein
MAARPTILFALIFVFCFSAGPFLRPVYISAAENPCSAVVVNEISWMGTQRSSSDEWLELYNNANYGINLSGWSLKAKDSLAIQLEGAIPAKGFYLLERTDDEALPSIKADQIFKGSLNNKGMELSLYDKNGALMDRVDCSAGWFGGNNGTKQTMERINPAEEGGTAGNWQTSLPEGGTPKEKNSLGAAKGQSQKVKTPGGQNQDEAVKKADLGASLNSDDKSSEPIGSRAKMTAFGLAISSGAIIIFLKRGLRRIKN